MTPPSDATFEAKTWAELLRLSGECAKVRRAMPTGHYCGGCRYCVTLRAMHRSIDDHIDQLLGRVPDEDTSLPPTYCATLKADNWKPDGNAKGAKCQHCERSRYINTKGARLCFACDMAPLSGEWEVLHADEAEQ